MQCATCAKDTVIEIHMRVAGDDVRFRRCSVCEQSEWDGSEGERSLGDILELARTH